MLDRFSLVSLVRSASGPQVRSPFAGSRWLGLAIGLVLAGCSSATVEAPSQPAAQTGALPLPNVPPAAMLPSPSASPSDVKSLLKAWPRYESPQAGFAVAFPAKPQEETSRVPTEVGPAEVILLRYQDRAAKRFYLFAHNRFPVPAGAGLNVDRALDASRDSIAKGITAKVASEKPLQQSGYRGRDLEMVRSGGFAARVRIFYANGIWYRAIVAAEDGNLKAPQVRAFFESIQLMSPGEARKSNPAPPPPSPRP